MQDQAGDDDARTERIELISSAQLVTLGVLALLLALELVALALLPWLRLSHLAGKLAILGVVVSMVLAFALATPALRALRGGVRWLEVDRAAGLLHVRRLFGSVRLPIAEIRHVGVRSEERALSGGRGSGSGGIVHDWNVGLMSYRGAAAELERPADDAPLPQRWRYMESADWMTFRPARTAATGLLAARLARAIGCDCVLFGPDREPRFAPPERFVDLWDTYGAPND